MFYIVKPLSYPIYESNNKTSILILIKMWWKWLNFL